MMSVGAGKGGIYGSGSIQLFKGDIGRGGTLGEFDRQFVVKRGNCFTGQINFFDIVRRKHVDLEGCIEFGLFGHV